MSCKQCNLCSAAFLSALLNRQICSLQGELHRWYENCEMRTIVLSDDAGDGTTDPLWFPGGHQLQREGMTPAMDDLCCLLSHAEAISTKCLTSPAFFSGKRLACPLWTQPL